MTQPDTKTTNRIPRPPAAPKPSKSGRRLEKLRVLPLLMIVATLTFGVKLGDIWSGADAFVAGVPAAFAEDEVAAEEPAPAEAGNGSGTVESDEGAAADTAAKPSDAGQGWDASEPYSRGELQLLENLADRRAELDKRAKEIEMRERVLSAMEKRIDEKIAEMKSIEAQVASYLKDYDETHIENMQSLVKMYESMKPKDAARIFEQLQMDVLLEVAGNMKERQMASIMAEMSPDAAKALTMEMATKKPIPLAAN